MKKIIALFLAVLLVVSVSVPAFSTSIVNDYTITNPYDGINWETWKAYKTQLHCHTTASDGYQTIHEAISDYYSLDYDIVAITDHGTTNKYWNNVPQTSPLMRDIKKERTGGALNPIIPLTAEEYAGYTKGTAESAEYKYIKGTENGDVTVNTGYKRTHSNGLLDVYGGNELNLATPVCDCHLTCYWSDYGQGYAGVYGDYETPAREVNKDGGITMLSHIGEYVYPDKDSADHVGKPVDEYFVNKFARVFLDNPGSCVGMGINSATDAHTRCDRILYDSILLKTIPNGVTPWAFCFSDSHSQTSINDAYVYCYMPELTEEALRTCLTGGQLFAVSHYSNGFELNGMQEMVGYDDNPDNKRWMDNDVPMVTKIEVDEQNDIIRVWGTDFSYITWVSGGNVIKRELDIKDGYAELDLHDEKLLTDPYMFVRFYLTGDNGICYSQPFTIRRDGETFAPVDVPVTRDTPYYLRLLVTVLDWLIFKWNPVIWAFKYFAMGYNPIEQTVDSVTDLFKTIASSFQ